jgi:hypothetical protein
MASGVPKVSPMLRRRYAVRINGGIIAKYEKTKEGRKNLLVI